MAPGSSTVTTECWILSWRSQSYSETVSHWHNNTLFCNYLLTRTESFGLLRLRINSDVT